MKQFLRSYRQSLLAKQEELLATKCGRLVLGASGGLAGDFMDQALAESEATLGARLSQAKSSLLQAGMPSAERA
jgi:hypothetical protein